MSTLSFLLIFGSFAAIYFGLAWLDNKYGWQLVNWINGQSQQPFAPASKAKPQEAVIDNLTERIQVLEKIVTEPSYELNQKLNRL
ncbi:hypothetical protein [Paraglaciecola aestuariivivens]